MEGNRWGSGRVRGLPKQVRVEAKGRCWDRFLNCSSILTGLDALLSLGSLLRLDWLAREAMDLLL